MKSDGYEDRDGGLTGVPHVKYSSADAEERGSRETEPKHSEKRKKEKKFLGRKSKEDERVARLGWCRSSFTMTKKKGGGTRGSRRQNSRTKKKGTHLQQNGGGKGKLQGGFLAAFRGKNLNMEQAFGAA